MKSQYITRINLGDPAISHMEYYFLAYEVYGDVELKKGSLIVAASDHANPHEVFDQSKNLISKSLFNSDPIFITDFKKV